MDTPIITGRTFFGGAEMTSSEAEDTDDATTSRRRSIAIMVTNKANAVFNFMMERKGGREIERETCATINGLRRKINCINRKYLFVCGV